VPTAETGGIEYQLRRLLADRPVVAVKLLLAGVGAIVKMGPPSQCSRRHLRRPTASPTAGGSRLHSSVRPASHKAPGGISWRVKGAEANGSRLH
jgi:hypothetical protein